MNYAAVARARRFTSASSSLPGLAMLLCTVVSTACGGTQYRHNVVETEDVRYRMPPPPGGFERVKIEDYDLSYSHKQWGTMGVHAICRGYEDVPAKALLNQLLFGTTERKKELIETVTIDGRGALHARYRVALDGVPVRLEVYVVNKNGCLFDFTLVTGAGAGTEGRDAFEAWVAGFAMLSRYR